MTRIRTFVAVDIEAAVRRAIRDLIQSLSDTSTPVSWVRLEDLHVTVKFLGDVEDKDVYGVCRAVSGAVAGLQPFRTVCLGAGAFPHRDRPRTLWVGLKDPDGQMADLHERIAAALDDLGFPREIRPFRPHVTIGRIKGGQRHDDRLPERLHEFAKREFGTVRVDQCVIYSSELTRKGPVYTPMGHAAFGP